MTKWLSTAALALLLGGCVTALDVPRGGPCSSRSDCGQGMTCSSGRCTVACDDADCAPYACDNKTNECNDTCEDSDDCSAGAICEDRLAGKGGECVSACEELDCGGYLCDELNGVCYESCGTDEQCHWSTTCCTQEQLADGDCEQDELNTCQ